MATYYLGLFSRRTSSPRTAHTGASFFRGAGEFAGEYPDGITSVEGVPAAADVVVQLRAPGTPFDGLTVTAVSSNVAGVWAVDAVRPGLKYSVVGRKDTQRDVIHSEVVPLAPLKIAPLGTLVLPGSEDRSYTLRAYGGVPPYTYSITSTPPTWMAVSGDQLVVTAAPSTVSSGTATVMVTDSRSATSSMTVPYRTFVIPLRMATSSAANQSVSPSTAFSGFFTVKNGVPPYTYSVSAGALPSGVTLNTSTGEFSGTLSATETTYNFTITATDAASSTVSRAFRLVVSSLAKHRYWRINITSSNTYCSVTEIEMAATAAGANMCTGGGAIASGNYGAGHEEANAFNGVLGDPPWASANSSSGWIGYDFGTPMPVAEVRICARYGTYVQSPNTFAIQYSDDAASWTTTTSYSGQTSWPTAAFKTFAA